MTKKANNKLRIGIIGAGNIVRTRHLPALKRNPDVEIVAVSNSTYASAEKFCSENVPQATPMRNWADLLAVPDLDIIWIGTPPYMHSAVTISALEAGKHVFCQARMSMDLAEAGEMLAVSKRFPELVTMLCPPPYGMRADLLIKKLLAENSIGKPHDIRMQSFNGQYLNPEAPAHWRQKIEISGLNVLTLGIYVEVMQRWLGEIVGVFARGKILTAERRGYQVIVPDMFNVLCVFENGAEGVLEFSGVHAGAANDRLRIFGDRGALLYDFTNERVRGVKYGGREMEDVDVPKELVTDWRGGRQFHNAVKSKSRVRPRPNFEDGVRYMRVVQAVADSRAGNEWVAIKK